MHKSLLQTIEPVKSRATKECRQVFHRLSELMIVDVTATVFLTKDEKDAGIGLRKGLLGGSIRYRVADSRKWIDDHFVGGTET